jgi:hypothetical protein
VAQLEWTESEGVGKYPVWDAEGAKYDYKATAYKPSAADTGFKVEEIDHGVQRRVDHKGVEDVAKQTAQDWEDGWV